MADPANHPQRMAARATGINPVSTAKPRKQQQPEKPLPPPTPEQNQMLQAFFQAAKEQRNLVPGLGFADQAYDPMKGLQKYSDDKAARKRRVENAMNKLNLPHTPVMARMNMSPGQAIMHARRS